MKKLFLLPLAALLIAPVTAAAPAADSELTKPIRQFIDGFNTGDTKSAYAAYVQGDVVIIEAKVIRLRSRMGLLKGDARVNGKVVVEGTMTFALGPARAPSAS